MQGDIAARFERARTMPELFDLVKECVRRRLGLERSGLMLGLSNLGGGLQGLVGGFFQVGGNMIVVNSLPLKRIEETDPSLRKPYIFHILLHEYAHSIGYLDEAATRQVTLDISRSIFGEGHVVARLAEGWERFLPNLVYPVYGWRPEGDFSIEVVPGFDLDSTASYIH